MVGVFVGVGLGYGVGGYGCMSGVYVWGRVGICRCGVDIRLECRGVYRQGRIQEFSVGAGR